MFIWQQSDWPLWRFDEATLAMSLAQVRHAQGRLLGRMQALGFALRNQATLAALTSDVLNTSEIEGLPLNPDAVRSSLARRLAVPSGRRLPNVPPTPHCATSTI